MENVRSTSRLFSIIFTTMFFLYPSILLFPYCYNKKSFEGHLFTYIPDQGVKITVIVRFYKFLPIFY